jgi:hypothetical protein
MRSCIALDGGDFDRRTALIAYHRRANGVSKALAHEQTVAAISDEMKEIRAAELKAEYDRKLSVLLAKSRN